MRCAPHQTDIICSSKSESRWVIHVVILACALLLALPYWLGSYLLPKTEDFEYSLIPSLLYSKQIFSTLGPAWWNPQIGLGSPWPIPSSITHSPFNIAFNYLKPFTTIGIIVFAHTCFLGYSCWLLFRRMGLRGQVLTVATFSLLLSTVIEYLYWSDAIIVYTTWTVIPFLFLTVDILLNDHPARAWVAASALGITGGYMALNGHLGVFSIYLTGVLLFTLTQKKFLSERFVLLVFSALTAALIGAEKLVLILNETALFPPNSPRDQQGLHGGLSGVIQNTFVRPFFLPTSNDLSDISKFLNHFAGSNNFSRTVGFGSAFAICAMIYIRFLYRNRSKLSQDSQLRSQLILLFGSMLLLFWPLSWLPNFLSATWPLRDLIHLFGILLAGKSIMFFMNHPDSSPKVQRKFLFLLFVQVSVIALNALAMVQGANWLITRGKLDVDSYSRFADPSHESAYLRMLHKNSDQSTSRIIATGQASYMMDREMLVDQGAINNFSVLSGFSEVSFIAKGISFDSIRSAQSVPYGLITGDRLVRWRVQENLATDWVRDDQALLSLLGINLVIAESSEPIRAANLSRLGSLEGKDGYSISVFKNTKPLPLAFSVPNSVLAQELTQRPNCAQPSSLYCLDVSPIVKVADGSQIKSTMERDNIYVELHGDISTEQSILLSSMHRPDWRLSDLSAQAGVILEDWHGLILIKTPPNVSHIGIHYRPDRLISARKVTLFSIAASLLIFGFLMWRRR